VITAIGRRADEGEGGSSTYEFVRDAEPYKCKTDEEEDGSSGSADEDAECGIKQGVITIDHKLTFGSACSGRPGDPWWAVGCVCDCGSIVPIEEGTFSFCSPGGGYYTNNPGDTPPYRIPGWIDNPDYDPVPPLYKQPSIFRGAGSDSRPTLVQWLTPIMAHRWVPDGRPAIDFKLATAEKVAQRATLSDLRNMGRRGVENVVGALRYFVSGPEDNPWPREAYAQSSSFLCRVPLQVGPPDIDILLAEGDGTVLETSSIATSDLVLKLESSAILGFTTCSDGCYIGEPLQPFCSEEWFGVSGDADFPGSGPSGEDCTCGCTGVVRAPEDAADEDLMIAEPVSTFKCLIDDNGPLITASGKLYSNRDGKLEVGDYDGPHEGPVIKTDCFLTPEKGREDDLVKPKNTCWDYYMKTFGIGNERCIAAYRYPWIIDEFDKSPIDLIIPEGDKIIRDGVETSGRIFNNNDVNWYWRDPDCPIPKPDLEPEPPVPIIWHDIWVTSQQECLNKAPPGEYQYQHHFNLEKGFGEPGGHEPVIEVDELKADPYNLREK